MRLFICALLCVLGTARVAASGLTIEVDTDLMHLYLVDNDSEHTFYTYHRLGLFGDALDDDNYHAIGAEIVIDRLALTLGAINTLGLPQLLFDPLGYRGQSTHHYRVGAATLNSRAAPSPRNGFALSYYNELSVYGLAYATDETHIALFGFSFSIGEIVIIEQAHALSFFARPPSDAYWFRDDNYFLGAELFVHALRLHVTPDEWHIVCSALVQHATIHYPQYGALCAVQFERRDIEVYGTVGVLSEYYLDEEGHLIDEWLYLQARYLQYPIDGLRIAAEAALTFYKPEGYYATVDFDNSLPRVTALTELTHEVELDASALNEASIKYGLGANIDYDLRNSASYLLRARLTPQIALVIDFFRFSVRAPIAHGDERWRDLTLSVDADFVFDEIEGGIALDYEYAIERELHRRLDLGIALEYDPSWGRIYGNLTFDLLANDFVSELEYRTGVRIEL